jgi:hypothetical protein
VLTVRFKGEEWTYDPDTELRSLTGLESAEVEEFLGGWHKFKAGGGTTRSAIVLVWLGQRSAGGKQTLEEIGNTPGFLLDEDGFDVEGDADMPEDPKVDPGRPLPVPNGNSGSRGGSSGSERSPVTSVASGTPDSEGSTG